jgi:hypothetical protein
MTARVVVSELADADLAAIIPVIAREAGVATPKNMLVGSKACSIDWPPTRNVARSGGTSGRIFESAWCSPISSSIGERTPTIW